MGLKPPPAWNVPAELAARTARFRALLNELSLPAAWLNDPENVRYLSGFTGGDSTLLVTRREKFLLTDFRYAEEARRTVRGCAVVLRRAEMTAAAVELARKLRLKRLGVERRRLTLADRDALARGLAGRARLVPTEGLVERLRERKSPRELAVIRAGLRLAERAFRETLACLRPGIREVEVAAELEYRMRRLGAQGAAFPTIVAFGRHAARPHAQPRRDSPPLRENDLVLIDWGARLEHYNCDLTRTFAFGRMPARLAQLYQIVQAAQRAAVRVARAGVPLREIDRAARAVIESAGWGRAFGHGTGHGLGLEVHEAPGLSRRARGEAADGMVVTIEPGIYCPAAGGVRIEDDVLIRSGGAEVLSSLPREMELSDG